MFNNEKELIDAGFVLTPEVAHTGAGNGKLYEKIESEMDGDTQVDRRTYFVVLPDGTVKDYVPNVGVKEEVQATVEVPVPTVDTEVEPVVEPEAETAPEAQE